MEESLEILPGWDKGQTPLLAPLDAADLSSKGFIGHLPNGLLQLHVRFLDGRSEEYYKHLPLVRYDSPEASGKFFIIPSRIFSYATLRYVGFTKKMSFDIWLHWSHPAPGSPPREVDPYDGERQTTFFELFTSELDACHNGPNDTCSEDDWEWFRCMQHYGIDMDLQLEIMDPKFKEMRLNYMCCDLVKDIVSRRYAALSAIRDQSLKREADLRKPEPHLWVGEKEAALRAHGTALNKIQITICEEAMALLKVEDVLCDHHMAASENGPNRHAWVERARIYKTRNSERREYLHRCKTSLLSGAIAHEDEEALDKRAASLRDQAAVLHRRAAASQNALGDIQRKQRVSSLVI